VDGGEDVERHPARAQVVEAAHHLVEAAAAALRHAVRVVDLPRPVDRYPDEEVVLTEEVGPFRIDLRAVGLDRVARPLAVAHMAIDQLDGAAEEVAPMSVGSPPCQATSTTGAEPWASMSWRM
jgi:hypothetical protein